MSDEEIVKQVIQSQMNNRFRDNKKKLYKSSFALQQLPSYIKRDPLLLYNFKRVHYQDKNSLIVCVGETGAGKSESMCVLADMLDITPLGNEMYQKDFILTDDGMGNPTRDCRVVFTANDFLRLNNSNLPKGSVIVWDEAGIDNDNTEWYKKKSQIVKHVLQVFRHKNYIIIFTVPDIESITLGTRRLAHLIIDVQERNEKAAKCNVTWLQRARGFEKTKTYPKKPAYIDEKTGRPTMAQEYWIPKLRDELALPYRRIKNRFGNDLYNFSENEMKEMERIEKQFSGKLDEVSETLRPFNIIKCMDLVNDHKEEFEELTKERIMYFLAKKGYECKVTNAKLIIENLT